MKKTGIVLVAVATGFILFAAFSRPASSIPSEAPKNIPDSVWMVIEKSCYGCHADDGNGMAKGKLNFDSWDNYDAGKQLSKAQDICKVVEKGKMPPSKFSKNNPEAVPTAEDIKRLCDWSTQLGK